MKPDLEVRPFEPTDEGWVIALWRRSGLVVPKNDPQRDIALKLQTQPQLFLVGHLGSVGAATVMAGYDGHRGWLNYLAVEPELRRRSLGSQMMAAAERALVQLGCPKVNLQIRASNGATVSFYRSLGYSVDDVISMGKRL